MSLRPDAAPRFTRERSLVRNQPRPSFSPGLLPQTRGFEGVLPRSPPSIPAGISRQQAAIHWAEAAFYCPNRAVVARNPPGL